MPFLNFSVFIYPEQVVIGKCSICQKIVSKEQFKDEHEKHKAREKMQKIKSCPFCNSLFDEKGTVA